MRFEHGFSIRLPYLSTQEDGTVQRAHAFISTMDACDHRQVKTIIRKWVKQNLGRNLHPEEQRGLIKHNLVVHKVAGQQMLRVRRVATEEEVSSLNAGKSAIMSEKYPNVLKEDEAAHEVLEEDYLARRTAGMQREYLAQTDS